MEPIEIKNRLIGVLNVLDSINVHSRDDIIRLAGIFGTLENIVSSLDVPDITTTSEELGDE